jgi:hypothetical protein
MGKEKGWEEDGKGKRMGEMEERKGKGTIDALIV